MSVSGKFVPNSHFRPSQDRADVCANCRAPFDAHHNGQCPVDENTEQDVPVVKRGG